MTAAERGSRRARTSVWLDGGPAPARKSDQPTGLDRDKIVATTVRLLDSEGLGKFSMRRLAAELGVTAMSVYWYVDTKDDLLELALDAVTGKVALPDEGEGDWRDQLRRLADAYRTLLVTHPWVSRLMGEYLNVGPAAMAFTGAAQRALRSSGLTAAQLPGAMALVHQFVYGFGTTESRCVARCREACVSQDDFLRQVRGAIEDRQEFQEAWEVIEARDGTTAEERRTRDFDFALDCAIASIEAMRDRSAPGPQRRETASGSHTTDRQGTAP
ncbi:TetR/AcrR family transcriptional regulator [Streptomyces sp. KR80]|uniref:TetR/AcrR family transcriptional regulator n=1 Tax=Streptomyces sp. KR80 TaxID=3457426 RepID=UPI003FD4F16B